MVGGCGGGKGVITDFESCACMKRKFFHFYLPGWYKNKEGEGEGARGGRRLKDGRRGALGWDSARVCVSVCLGAKGGRGEHVGGTVKRYEKNKKPHERRQGRAVQQRSLVFSCMFLCASLCTLIHFFLFCFNCSQSTHGTDAIPMPSPHSA
jgi:hypothetical protein